MDERIIALADYLDVNPDTISEGYDANVYETEDGEEYIVVTEDEARELAEESIKNFIDECGITGFTEGFQEWIKDNALDTEWFEEAMSEANGFYFDDVLEEDSDEFENRAIEALYEWGIISDEDFEEDEDGNVDHSQFIGDPRDYRDEFIDAMNEDFDDPVEWFKDNFGDEALNDVVSKNSDILDIDEIVDTSIEWDGVAHFIATYDGDEIELDGAFYAYRLN